MTVVVVGVEQGIILAVILSICDHLRRSYKPNDVLLVRRSPGHVATVPLDTGAQLLPGLIGYRFAASLYYTNANRFQEEILGLVNAATTPVEWLCIDASAVVDIDFSGAETVRDVVGELAERHVHVVVADITESLRAQLAEWKDPIVAEADYYDTIADVIEAFTARTPPTA